jgi:hypothetical protein
MEKLLEDACDGVLQRVKAKVLLILRAEGVEVDPCTFEVASVAPGDSVTRASSVRIYLLADSVRLLFVRDMAYSSAHFVLTPLIMLQEQEMTRVLVDASLPVDRDSSSDLQSNQSLMRAISVHSSHLLGHITVMLRHSSISCKSAARGSDQASAASLQMASLVLGRIAWLLKINGRFLEDAFRPSGASSVLAAGRDLVSEDQLFSAFEIADINGDGIITLPEATEVYHTNVHKCT